MRTSSNKRAITVAIATVFGLTATTAFALSAELDGDGEVTAPSTASVSVEPTTTLPPVPATTPVTVSKALLQETYEHGVLTRAYAWGEQSESVRELQTLVGVTTDGLYGKVTRGAHVNALEARGLDTSGVPSAPKSSYSYGERQCPQWEDLARSVGWPEEQIKKMSYVLYKESRCNPDAHNPNDPTSAGSRGLMQINGYWCIPNKYNPIGWLQEQGILSSCDDLYDPVTNLRAGLAIWMRSGWSPWNV